MHQKKIPRVKRSILHSIPLLRISSGYTVNRSIPITSTITNYLHNNSNKNNSKNKQLFRYLSSSIPLACMVALLFISICIVSPSSKNVVYAEEEGSSSSSSSSNPSDNSKASDSTASLTIGGAGMDDIVPVSSGEVAYRKHTITVDATNAEEYYLIISGPTSLTGSTTISGADNKLPAEMPNNSWGYAYSDNSVEDTLNYQSFTGSAETIDSGTGPTNFTKNLIFAAKFGDDAVSGHYTGQVTLSLASTPGEVVLPTNPVETWEELQSMQQMTSKACASIGTAGSNNYPSKTLVDSRDGNEYTITKLDDQNCWMTSNLRITGDSIKAKDPSNTTGKITSADSDVSTDYLIPASSSPWSDTSATTNKVHYAGNTTNGANYTWCAATAGSCGGAENNTDAKASSSICPKGWKLPMKAEYDTLKAKGTNKVDSNTSDSIFDGWNIGGGFFPTAGYVVDGSLSDVGSYGRYWSSTAYDSNGAYHLIFGSGNVITDWSVRYYGYSVRCVAQTEQDEKEQEVITNTKGFGGIKKLQDMTSSICSRSSIPKGTTGQLYDTRDLNIYDVAKLDDGKCWMTQNLRLTGESLTANGHSLTLTTVDSNASNYTFPTSSSSISGGVYYDNNTTYGAYYRGYVAIAGSVITIDGDFTSDSICPKGWRLPTGTQYNTLLNSAGIANDNAGSAKIRGVPYNFVYAGSNDGGSLQNVGSLGAYWVSTAGSTTSGAGTAGRHFEIRENSVVVAGNTRWSYVGSSVRCISQ